MKDLFYKIIVGVIILICLAAILASLYAAQDCSKRGGRYMRGMLSTYECVLQ